jgi:hypothetical protein
MIAAVATEAAGLGTATVVEEVGEEVAGEVEERGGRVKSKIPKSSTQSLKRGVLAAKLQPPHLDKTTMKTRIKQKLICRQTKQMLISLCRHQRTPLHALPHFLFQLTAIDRAPNSARIPDRAGELTSRGANAARGDRTLLIM